MHHCHLLVMGKTFYGDIRATVVASHTSGGAPRIAEAMTENTEV